MPTIKLDEIVRHRDRELKAVVEQLARGQVAEAIAGLERQGRVHEVKEPAPRMKPLHRNMRDCLRTRWLFLLITAPAPGSTPGFTLNCRPKESSARKRIGLMRLCPGRT